MDTSKLITLMEVAKLLNRHPIQIHRYFKSGKLKKYKILNRVFCDKEEVENLLTPKVDE